MDFDVSSVEALRPLSEVLAAVLDVAGARSVEVLLVGAIARDLLAQFEAPARGRHRVSVQGCQVDVVPFGPLEHPPGSISFDEDSRMSVLGHAETLAHADVFRLPGGVSIRVPCPPALSVLKLLAWVDRGRSTAKDARDLGKIFGVYTAPFWNDHLFEAGAAHLDAHDYDVGLASVSLLGAEAAAMHSPATRDAVLAVDRDRLVAALTPHWFEPGATARDVAAALDVYLTAFG